MSGIAHDFVIPFTRDELEMVSAAVRTMSLYLAATPNRDNNDSTELGQLADRLHKILKGERA